MAFSKLKAHLRRIGPRTFDQLIEAIGEICDLFTPDECWNFFHAAANFATINHPALNLLRRAPGKISLPQNGDQRHRTIPTWRLSSSNNHSVDCPDPKGAFAREGARRMLAEALKAEADGFVARFAAEHLEDGRQRIVRHGFGPQRQIQTGIGAPDVQRPRLRDRIATPDPAEKIRLTSTILPKWARCSVSLDGLLPVLYLKGISTGDFRKALSAIIGPDARNLSPGVISRLTAGRQAEYDAWTRHDLSARHSICILSASGRMASVFRLGWQKTLDLFR